MITQLSCLVAHHLHFEFLPAEERFLDEYLADWRHIESARDDDVEFLTIVSDAAAGAAKSECGTDDQWHGADLRCDLARFLHGVRDAGFRHIEADLDHRLLEGQAVFALVDGLGLRADHPDVVLCEHAGLVELHRAIQRGLAAECREQRVRPFRGNDLLDDLGSDRLDVRPVRELRVSHDRRRVRVHENDLVTLFLQGFAGLDT
jgi:hypothetical protein